MSRYKTGHKTATISLFSSGPLRGVGKYLCSGSFHCCHLTPVMAARAQHAVQPRLSMENTTVTADNNVEKNVASLAANAGTFLPLIAMRHGLYYRNGHR